MNILILEYATAMGCTDPAITTEGRAMLQAIIQDFSILDESNSGNNRFNISYLISKDSKPLDSGTCRPITIHEDVNDWIKSNIYDYDYCLPIAPEEDYILYGLTRSIEKYGVKVLGSSYNAVLTCTNKYNTYKTLRDIVPIIRTEKIRWDEISELEQIFPAKKVIKPADGVSCSEVQVVTSFEEFKDAALDIKKVTSLPYFLIQDWKAGDSVSVSLLANDKKAVPISLNQQKLDLNDGKIGYKGGKVPFDHLLGEEAKKIARLAVESIEGLRGYVGVDMILGDEVHLVEINSRITTPYVALRNMLNFNLTEAIFRSINGDLPSEISLEGNYEFQKNGNTLELQVV